MATTSLPTLTLDGARMAIDAAESYAQSIGISMNIAVVDSACHLLAFIRMDGAKITSINLAIDKAFTAAGHRIPTSSYKGNVWPGGAAFGIWNSNGGRFTTIGGGVPIMDGTGIVLGAVGCSSGTPAQDEEVALAGINAVRRSMIQNDVEEKRGGEGEMQTSSDANEKLMLSQTKL